MMMGLAIAHEIRNQVVFTNQPIAVNPTCNFDFERQESKSALGVGSKITVV